MLRSSIHSLLIKAKPVRLPSSCHPRWRPLRPPQLRVVIVPPPGPVGLRFRRWPDGECSRPPASCTGRHFWVAGGRSSPTLGCCCRRCRRPPGAGLLVGRGCRLSPNRLPPRQLPVDAARSIAPSRPRCPRWMPVDADRPVAPSRPRFPSNRRCCPVWGRRLFGSAGVVVVELKRQLLLATVVLWLVRPGSWLDSSGAVA